MRSSAQTKGFTLIELMVSISIVAILATIGAVLYSSTQQTARNSKRSQDIQAIATALEVYKSANGKYLASSGYSSSNPVVNPATFVCISSLASSISPNYMPIVPEDPFFSSSSPTTNCYLYVSDGKDYKIRTYDQPLVTTDLPDGILRQQQTLLDPRRDGGTGYNITTCGSNLNGGATATAWAVYSLGARCW